MDSLILKFRIYCSVASSIGAIVALLDSPAKLNEELDSISEIHMDKQVKPTDFEVRA